MRYQEQIYIHNDNNSVRNKDILNANMSSDFCIFKSPTFNVTGATKVQCDTIGCNVSNSSFTDMLSAATYNCFVTGGTSLSAYTSTSWQTRVFEDSIIKYSGTFYTTTTISGDTPLEEYFITSVDTAYTSLGYEYTKSGSTFYLHKPYGVKEVELDICIKFQLDNLTTCPAGYLFTPANDGCQKITTSAATFSSSGSTIIRGDVSDVYGVAGTYFYPSIQHNGALPLFYDNSTETLKDQTGGTISELSINSSNSFWASLFSPSNGRLNKVSLASTNTEYLGFSKCISATTGGTYYIGIAADNYCRVRLNGVTYIDFNDPSAGSNFNKWNVFPFELNSGLNIFEMEGKNHVSLASFGAEIYKPIDFTTLTGSTSSATTGTIFSTLEYTGQTWQLGTTTGYSCSSGYALNSCGSGFTCTQILTSDIITSGECTPTCFNICNDSFQYIDNTSTGVHINSLTSTTLPVSFIFTGNTSSFIDNSVLFNFNVYKYDNLLNVFSKNPSYESNIYTYSAFSGTNIINTYIPLSAFTLDGDYLIKGFFEGNACTDFMYRLGKKINTSSYVFGKTYELYDEDLDYYFVSVLEAEKPLFTQTQPDGIIYYNALPLYQEAVLIDNLVYSGTGNTIVTQHEYFGNIVLTLNGLTLTKNIDYTITGQSITFSGSITSGDVVTIIYTRSPTTTLVCDSINVGVIPSGITNSQGSSSYFYNTTTGYYEVFTDNIPIDNSKIILMKNGNVLVNDIDYYQSTTNKNRIILNGSITTSDLINIIYYPMANIVKRVSKNLNYIGWYITIPPQSENGFFTLEYDTNTSFSSSTIANIVDYKVQVTNYNTTISLTGDVGTIYYYRVKNTKNYVSICGDIIESINYSEIVPITIQTNALNTY